MWSEEVRAVVSARLSDVQRCLSVVSDPGGFVVVVVVVVAVVHSSREGQQHSCKLG